MERKSLLNPLIDPNIVKSESQIMPTPTVKYIDVLVDITLQFIQAKYDDDITYFQPEKVAECITVNASACEFMELILKQIEKYPDPKVACDVGHLII